MSKYLLFGSGVFYEKIFKPKPRPARGNLTFETSGVMWAVDLRLAQESFFMR